jgi:hypothetical protein
MSHLRLFFCKSKPKAILNCPLELSVHRMELRSIPVIRQQIKINDCTRNNCNQMLQLFRNILYESLVLKLSEVACTNVGKRNYSKTFSTHYLLHFHKSLHGLRAGERIRDQFFDRKLERHE